MVANVLLCTTLLLLWDTSLTEPSVQDFSWKLSVVVPNCCPLESISVLLPLSCPTSLTL